MPLSFAITATAISPFVAILTFFIYYTHQISSDIRTILNSNKGKRNGVILTLLVDAKRLLDHVAASIRTEVIDNENKASDLTLEKIRYYRKKCDEAYILIDDSSDIRNAMRILLDNMGGIRFNVIVMLMSAVAASITLSATWNTPDFEAVVGFWIFIFMVEMPLNIYRALSYYKEYRLTRNLLSNHKVGINDEAT